MAKPSVVTGCLNRIIENFHPTTLIIVVIRGKGNLTPIRWYRSASAAGKTKLADEEMSINM